jgi:hypothetical protein
MTSHAPRPRTNGRVGRAAPVKILNMKIEPTIYMKTKDSTTKSPIMTRAFVPTLRHFCKNGRLSLGLLGRKCAHDVGIGAKPGARSAQRFIGPSNHRLETESLLDGAMSRWSDDPILSQSKRLTTEGKEATEKALYECSVPVISAPPIPRFFAAHEDSVPRASCPCSGMAKMAMAQLWLRLCRAVKTCA